MKTLRVLPPDVFDALELSALAFGGIGASGFKDSYGNPLCAVGHRWFLEGNDRKDVNELTYAFLSADIDGCSNDPAVFAINERRGARLSDRVPFDKWCKELNVVRGK